MNYALEVSEHNTQAHLDIENAIQKQKDGLFTFTLRINNGNIVDFVINEYADARKYLKLTEVIVQEFTVAHHIVIGNKSDSIRTNDGKRPT